MTSTTDFADRITAVLENAHGALDTLDQSNRTGAVADQGAVNTLRKLVQDMGTIAVDARKAAMDESAEADSQASADANRASTTTGTDAANAQPAAKDSGTGSAKSPSSASTSGSSSKS